MRREKQVYAALHRQGATASLQQSGTLPSPQQNRSAIKFVASIAMEPTKQGVPADPSSQQQPQPHLPAAALPPQQGTVQRPPQQPYASVYGVLWQPQQFVEVEVRPYMTMRLPQRFVEVRPYLPMPQPQPQHFVGNIQHGDTIPTSLAL